jgi:GT2 family glycosyltransferase
LARNSIAGLYLTSCSEPKSRVATTNIAILLACYNRREKTLACLERLRRQQLPDNVCYETILVDDGSSDGTGDAVNEHFPETIVIRGTGGLYWNQGMRLAWATAIDRSDYDYYLLLNDDTELYDDAIARLLETETSLRSASGRPSIVVGSIADPIDGHQTYGGVTRVKNYIGIRFSLVEPSTVPLPCDTFNANCVLISKEIVAAVGILSDRFSHAMGDADYGLRAKEQGYDCCIAPGYVGTCSINAPANTWLDVSLPLKERKKLLHSPKGQRPDEWLYFVRRHAGVVWVLSWVQLNMRLYFPTLWKSLRRLRGRNE